MPSLTAVGRSSSYELADFEDAVTQFDLFLTAAFQDLRFVDMSQCLGVSEMMTGDAVHYRLTIPSLMGQMLFAQLIGEEVEGLEFDRIVVDYWLDLERRFLSRLDIDIEATNTVRDETAQVALTLGILSTDNIQLQVPYAVRLLATERGVIEHVPEGQAFYESLGALQDTYPQSELIAIAGARHYVIVTHADLLSKHILDWMGAQ